MDICIDTNTKNAKEAEKQCPNGYHIEFTNRGYVLFVRDGYYYDKKYDICYKDSK